VSICSDAVGVACVVCDEYIGDRTLVCSLTHNRVVADEVPVVYGADWDVDTLDILEIPTDVPDLRAVV
jgi:hypothetical protein